MTILIALSAGLIFGIGLIVSGMADPLKVRGFLDLAGNWDPSLLFVMGGAIAVGLVAFNVAGRRSDSLLGFPLSMAASRQIDLRLIAGSLTFGIGWGLAGICPGPALVLLGIGVPQGLIFTMAMLAGMGIFEIFERSKS